MYWVSKEERRKGGLGEVKGDQSQGLPRERMLGGRLDGWKLKDGGESGKLKDGGESGKYHGEVERSRKYGGPEGGRGG